MSGTRPRETAGGAPPTALAPPSEGHLGGALRRAWVGYQRRLDERMAVAGFDRRLPHGRVLRICARAPDVTVSQLGRELRITRQGASKLVAQLRARQYVSLEPSGLDRREKIVRLTPRAVEYLATQRRAAQAIEHELRSEIGPEAFATLDRLLQALGGDEQPRMRDYLRSAADLGPET